MNQYIEPIKSAILLFPLVALMFTIPYMVIQYRKYGAILLLRTLIIYSFILYLMCAYFLTILPLPSQEAVDKLTSPAFQYIPFAEVADLIKTAEINLGHPETLLNLFIKRNALRILLAIVFNVIMTIPFGIYLRYYFHCAFRKTVLLSLGLSLIFELTQISALFGFYSRPYRLADVNDLMTNTLGGIIGYWIAPLIMRILPSRSRMDEVAYRRGTKVSVTRRAFAMMLDCFIIGGISLALIFTVPALKPPSNEAKDVLVWMGLWYVIDIAVYFMLGEWLLRGSTLGKRLLNLRLSDMRTGGRPKLWQYIVRYSVLYYIVLPTPVVLLFSVMYMGKSAKLMIGLGILCVILLGVYILFWVLVVVYVFTHSNQLLHGKLSLTQNVPSVMPVYHESASVEAQHDDH